MWFYHSSAKLPRDTPIARPHKRKKQDISLKNYRSIIFSICFSDIQCWRCRTQGENGKCHFKAFLGREKDRAREREWERKRSGDKFHKHIISCTARAKNALSFPYSDVIILSQIQPYQKSTTTSSWHYLRNKMIAHFFFRPRHQKLVERSINLTKQKVP